MKVIIVLPDFSSTFPGIEEIEDYEIERGKRENSGRQETLEEWAGGIGTEDSSLPSVPRRKRE